MQMADKAVETHFIRGTALNGGRHDWRRRRMMSNDGRRLVPEGTALT